MSVTDIYRTPKQKNMPFSQQLMEPFLKLTTYLVTKQISADTKNWYKPLYLTRSSWLKDRIQQQQQKKLQKAYKHREIE